MGRKGYMGISAQAVGVNIRQRHRWGARRKDLGSFVSGQQTTYTSNEKVSRIADQTIRNSFNGEGVEKVIPISESQATLYKPGKEGIFYRVETSHGTYQVKTSPTGRKIYGCKSQRDK